MQWNPDNSNLQGKLKKVELSRLKLRAGKTLFTGFFLPYLYSIYLNQI